MKGWYQVFLFPHIHFAVVSFCYTELSVVWGKYDFTKKRFWWLEESLTWSFPLLSLMPCPAGLFFFQFLQQLLLPACLPNPLRRLWAAEPCPGKGRAWYDSTHGSRLFCNTRTSSQTWSCGENLHRRCKYSTVFFSRMGTSYPGMLSWLLEAGFWMLNHKRNGTIHTLGKYFLCTLLKHAPKSWH